ncbi:MAG: tRNA lysidine(34) synthetase TilS [Lentimicrobium sp.]|jgi:tRNA(Ile)-lysidine synthase|nr:tRNA lysidine(34) synthetase TilS [Lentimicrobium sp.]MDD2527250.1 tRNA lysidine(34) synthetase TilS [Lentimicrobiaceae bacterium]MDD4596570.1 tRNA lysidine(34) synthetase TilS [Lentimicrobiaceae bacterium]MDY0024865.1 tRNA lysidine(34) synthetase TilS [Lentimicrobium sp.]
MLTAFKKYIADYSLFGQEDKVMLAISGGIDSMVMLELFQRSGLNFAIAHCNFGLRGNESNEDEKFVTSIAQAHNIPLYVKHFKTREYAGFNKISVQMAARYLRYEWFDELLQTEQYRVIATAHHLDDQIETFFINALRGTGISGLHGILPNRSNIVHPMMFAFRRQIEEFAVDEAIAFREDSSNRSSKYMRNKIRHDLLPLLGELNPDFRKTLTSTISRIREAETMLSRHMDEVKAKVTTIVDGLPAFNIEALKEFEPTDLYLYELLKPYNFSRFTTDDLYRALDELSGKQFFSPTHRVIKDRDLLLLTETGPGNESNTDEIRIEPGQEDITTPVNLKITHLSNTDVAEISKSGQIAMFDADLIDWPLRLRKWKEGDTFMPYGMTSSKKLSDYFIDNKFSIVEKENAWLLISGNKIAWLVGHRIGHSFRVTGETKNILKIELLEN